jgi:hypothetical protein
MTLTKFVRSVYPHVQGNLMGFALKPKPMLFVLGPKTIIFYLKPQAQAHSFHDLFEIL